ncbi:uncharacterized protein LOC111266737 [Varroa jacobsoni]|uniref:Uncharacterized protein n=1 Tax=Varroa destructor TaxID=109461 RepID=A0A7M7J784_VARDE|nr:uncharacterized protein LOC111244379 [Varroa destructor]XP_022700194.1 uncharacterized protein LOC111266737 [Varroa jacobsoni]
MCPRRRSSLVTMHSDKGVQEGSVPASGILILLVVLGGIAGVWINEFMVDDDFSDTTVYRTGVAGRSGGSRKIHYAVPTVSSLKDCEKVVSDALKDYVEKQAAVAAIDDEDEEEEKPRKKGGKKTAKKGDDSEEEAKPVSKKETKKKSKK